MPSYLVYFPGKCGTTEEHLRAAGLGGLVGEPGCQFTDAAGPDGGRGVIATWVDPRRPHLSPEPVYRSEEQDWAASKGPDGEPDGRCWFGRLKGLPVEPESLRRKARHAGEDVILEDEQAWHVPIARQLPHVLGIGKPRISERYRPFFEATEQAVERWMLVKDDAVQWRMSWSEGFAFAAAALAINYRINADVLDFLGLVTNEHLVSIVETAAEGLAIERALALIKKKAATSDSSPATCSIASGAPG